MGLELLRKPYNGISTVKNIYRFGGKARPHIDCVADMRYNEKKTNTQEVKAQPILKSVS